MNANATKKPSLVSEEMDALLEACGYTLAHDGMLYRDYRADGKRLIFNGTAITLQRWHDERELDRGPHWHTAFCLEINESIDTIALMDVLNGLGAINYWQLPEARQMIRDIQNQLRRTQTVAYHG